MGSEILAEDNSKFKELLQLTNELMRTFYSDLPLDRLFSLCNDDVLFLIPSCAQWSKSSSLLKSYLGSLNYNKKDFPVQLTDVAMQGFGCYWLITGKCHIEFADNIFLDIQYNLIVDDASNKISVLHFTVPYDIEQARKNYVVNNDFYKSLLDQKTEVLEMVVNTVNGGLKVSNDDEEFSFYYVSESLCKMFGYTMDEFMQMSKGTATGACYPADLKDGLRQIADCFKVGDTYKCEYRVRKKDGSLLWVLDSGRKFVDKDGTKRINSIISDNTAERETKDALHIEKERYNFALGRIDCVLCEYDVDADLLAMYSRSENSETIKTESVNYCKKVLNGEVVKEKYIASMVNVLKGNEITDLEIESDRMISPFKETRTILISAKPVRDSVGKVCRVLIMARDITKEKQAREKLQREASHDSLTGLYNYRYGCNILEKCFIDGNCQGALLIIDIDNFKQFNNHFGHMYGNAILINTADKLTKLCLDDDIVVRIGGDEFFMFLKDIKKVDAIVKGGRISEGLQEVETGIDGKGLSCSIGIAVVDNKLNTFSKLFNAADKALTWAKQNGKGTVELYQSNNKTYEEFEGYSKGRVLPDQSQSTGDLSGRQLLNFALDIFDKTENEQSALKILLGVLGRTYSLDLITVHQIGSPDVVWANEDTNVFSCENWSVLLPKADLYNLVENQDQSGTVVVQKDDLSGYSAAAHRLITQNNASTVLYAPIFGSGRHAGAISYTNINKRREWNKAERDVLGEVSRIMATRVLTSRAVANVEKKLENIVNFDSITGLISFTRFKEKMEKAFEQLVDKQYAVLYIDIEQFKYINEKLGYSEGDRILKDFADYINLNQKYIVCSTRAMADHFVVLLAVENDDFDITKQINIMHEGFREEENKKYDINIMFRTGVYIIDDRNVDVALCIDRANSARKAINHSQGSAVAIYSSEIGRKLKMENEFAANMEMGIENDEFQVYMQPKVRLTDYEIVGAEALVRWIKPDGSIIAPNNFVPLFEKNGFITKLDRFVFMKTVQQLAKWQAEGYDVLPVSVNASALHAKERDHALYVLNVLRQYDVSPALVEIELTESAIVDNQFEVENMLTQLRAYGVRTSIDDLGTGYSVLNMIMNMPVDVIKIDRDFITSCSNSVRGLSFLEHLIVMIKNLGYIVLCEGVETFSQASTLAKMGCELAQGYAFGQPMPISEFEQLLKKK